jgi:hypothetical protein
VSIIQKLTELQNGTLKTVNKANWYRVSESLKRLTKCADDLGIFSSTSSAFSGMSSATTPKARWQSAAYSARFIKVSTNSRTSLIHPILAQSTINFNTNKSTLECPALFEQR